MTPALLSCSGNNTQRTLHREVKINDHCGVLCLTRVTGGEVRSPEDRGRGARWDRAQVLAVASESLCCQLCHGA